MKRAIAVMAAMVALAWAQAAQAAQAQEALLIFATTSPPNSVNNTRVFHPWADAVNARGAGAIKIDVRDGVSLANKDNFYDRVLNDVIQISFGTQKYVGQKFPRSEVVGLPFQTDKAELGAIAFWRLYKTGLLDAEYDDAVPMFLSQLGQQNMHFAKPLKSIDNLTGIKTIITGKVDGDIATAMGMAAISHNAADIYESMSRGLTEGMIIPWAAFQPFRLAEVTSFHIDVGLGASPAMVFMAKKRYAALSAAARKALDDSSGEEASRAFGRANDGIDAEQRQAVIAKNQTVVRLTTEQEATWRQKLVNIPSEWAKRTPDGDKILSTYRDLLEKVKIGG